MALEGFGGAGGGGDSVCGGWCRGAMRWSIRHLCVIVR